MFVQSARSISEHVHEPKKFNQQRKRNRFKLTNRSQKALVAPMTHNQKAANTTVEYPIQKKNEKKILAERVLFRSINTKPPLRTTLMPYTQKMSNVTSVLPLHSTSRVMPVYRSRPIRPPNVPELAPPRSNSDEAASP